MTAVIEALDAAAAAPSLPLRTRVELGISRSGVLAELAGLVDRAVRKATHQECRGAGSGSGLTDPAEEHAMLLRATLARMNALLGRAHDDKEPTLEPMGSEAIQPAMERLCGARSRLLGAMAASERIGALRERCGPAIEDAEAAIGGASSRVTVVGDADARAEMGSSAAGAGAVDGVVEEVVAEDDDVDGPATSAAEIGIALLPRTRGNASIGRASSAPMASSGRGSLVPHVPTVRLSQAQSSAIDATLRTAAAEANEYSLARGDTRMDTLLSVRAMANASMHMATARAVGASEIDASMHGLKIMSDTALAGEIVTATEQAQAAAVQATERLQDTLVRNARTQAAQALRSARADALLDLETRVAEGPGACAMLSSFVHSAALATAIALLVWLLSDRAFSVLVAISDAVVPADCLALVSPAHEASSWGLFGWAGSGMSTALRCGGVSLAYLGGAALLAWAGVAGWAFWGGAAFLLLRATLSEATTAFGHPGVATVASASLGTLFVTLLTGLAALFHRRGLTSAIHSRLSGLEIRGEHELPDPARLRADVLLRDMRRAHPTHGHVIRWVPVVLLVLGVALGLLVGDTMACSGRLLCLEGVAGAADSIGQVANAILAQLIVPSGAESPAA